MARPPATTPIGRVIEFLGSFGLAIVVLVFLLLTTWLGTLEQVHTSLYEVQRRYFESVVVFHDLFGIPVPLPGVYLLLWVLFVNLVVGGILRIRKSWKTSGIIIAHVGIIVLMAGSLMEYLESSKGHTSLLEGEQSDEFESYHEWEITVTAGDADSATRELVIPGAQFIDLGDTGRAQFTSPELPFSLEVHRVYPNTDPVPGRGAAQAGQPVVDGFSLLPRAQEKNAEADIAGCYVDIVRKDGTRETAILWGKQKFDHSVDVEGVRYGIGMHRRRWKLPFTVVLDDFRKVDHPGINMAKSYESDIRKIENGVAEPVLIRMNEPLRHHGYTLYQSGWQPPVRGDFRFMSTFSVVRNPADDVPLYACIVILIGLLLHFGTKLVETILRQSRIRVAGAASMTSGSPPPPSSSAPGGAA